MASRIESLSMLLFGLVLPFGVASVYLRSGDGRRYREAPHTAPLDAGRAEGARSRGRLGVTLMQVRSPKKAIHRGRHRTVLHLDLNVVWKRGSLLDRQFVG